MIEVIFWNKYGEAILIGGINRFEFATETEAFGFTNVISVPEAVEVRIGKTDYPIMPVMECILSKELQAELDAMTGGAI